MREVAEAALAPLEIQRHIASGAYKDPHHYLLRTYQHALSMSGLRAEVRELKRRLHEAEVERDAFKARLLDRPREVEPA